MTASRFFFAVLVLLGSSVAAVAATDATGDLLQGGQTGLQVLAVGFLLNMRSELSALRTAFENHARECPALRQFQAEEAPEPLPRQHHPHGRPSR